MEQFSDILWELLMGRPGHMDSTLLSERGESAAETEESEAYFLKDSEFFWNTVTKTGIDITSEIIDTSSYNDTTGKKGTESAK